MIDKEIKEERILDAILDITSNAEDLFMIIQHIYDTNKKLIKVTNDFQRESRYLSENQIIKNWRVKQ